MGLRSAIGETDFEPTQILGYAPIEPDGSFKIDVPADTPIALSVIDDHGRAFQVHTNWIQVRPGERRTCDGCHSPRRGGALNSGSVVDSVPSAWLAAMQAAHQQGETMADTRTRLDPTRLQLQPDMVYADAWADTKKANVQALPAFSLKYTGNDRPTDDLVTPAPANGVINYSDHIQPLWTRDRGSNTCTRCHDASDHLNLQATPGGDGRYASYDSLLIGDPQLDASGRPVVFFDDGVPMLARLPALVDTMASEDEVIGLARKSRLFEIMSGTVIMSGSDAQAAHPNPPATAPDHSLMLNKAEMRLLAEWIDTGGKYFNDPFNASSGVRSLHVLDETTFASTIYPIVTKTCAGCHQAFGSAGKINGNTFQDNRFVLTGSPDGDFNVTMTMISDTCHPPVDELLARPSTIPHPPGNTGQTAAILPAGGADYSTIASWILTGCPAP